MTGSNPDPRSGEKRVPLRAYLVLTLLLLALILLMLLRSARSRPTPADPRPMRQEEQLRQFADSLETALRGQQPPRRQRASRQRTTQESVQEEVPPVAVRRAPKATLTFELNSADTTDLQQLRGIGPTFARRIVRYRELLGGYVRKEQLLEVYGMTPERYRQIAAQLTVDPTEVTPIPVNEASIEQLKRHPYLDYYQAKAIVNYRKQGVHYNKIDDLTLISVLSDTTLRKIAPYIEY